MRQVAGGAAVTLVAFHARNTRLTLALARTTIALLCGRALRVALARCTNTARLSLTLASPAIGHRGT